MSSNLGIRYRACYGKLFSGLLNQFGTDYVSEIEDAIQNSFLKSLKLTTQGKVPDNPENWLFIVARNDVLNQIKKQKAPYTIATEENEDSFSAGSETDLRIQTIGFIITLKNSSNQAKILFALKNIFGLSIAEISDTTLINQEAIYKHINRTKRSMQQEVKNMEVDLHSIRINPHGAAIAEEIFYAVFNIGFDSFHEKTGRIVNDDLCLEAFALTKFFSDQYQYNSTRNLLALFCFHLARVPAKIENGKLISFFHQNREKWNKEFLHLGFHYLIKPKEINTYYLEAVIISKYMSVHPFKKADWMDIVKLYKWMQQISKSPIITLNYCFCLSKIGQSEDALTLLLNLEKELPQDHIYYSLVKATLLKEISPKESNGLFLSVMHKMKQKIRKEYVLENALQDLSAVHFTPIFT